MRIDNHEYFSFMFLRTSTTIICWWYILSTYMSLYRIVYICLIYTCICFCTELLTFCFSTDLFTFCLSTCLGIFCFFDCLCSVLVLWEATILYVGIKLSNDIVTLCIRECHESFSKSAVSLMKVELI